MGRAWFVRCTWAAVIVVAVGQVGGQTAPGEELVGHGVLVSDVRVGAGEGQERSVAFDVTWPESWRGPERPSWVAASDTWDAAWVFVKVRAPGDTWRHARLAARGHEASAGVALEVPADGMGAFVYRDAPGYGDMVASVTLSWDGLASGVPTDAQAEALVFAIEMVFVPEGPFWLGCGGGNDGGFRAGGTAGAPYDVSGQTSIELVDAAGALYWQETGHAGVPQGRTNASFPTGYEAFYVMKHHVTQAQYAAFLNSLTPTQAEARTYWGESYRHALVGSADGAYATSLPWVAMNMMSWSDGAAFADWAGLRPLTELEFEKVARGPVAPVPNEFAWGSTTIVAATALANAGAPDEAAEPEWANANFGQRLTPQGPLRVGSFALPGRSREAAGAGYYGALEVSGNLWERVVSVGNDAGRSFTGAHGDGDLDEAGDATITGWPAADGVGVGFRGGGWFNPEEHLRVSNRFAAALARDARDGSGGFRAARSAP